MTESLLFDWNELHLWDPAKQPREFRLVMSPTGIRPNSTFLNRMPFEVSTMNMNDSVISDLIEKMKKENSLQDKDESNTND